MVVPADNLQVIIVGGSLGVVIVVGAVILVLVAASCICLTKKKGIIVHIALKHSCAVKSILYYKCYDYDLDCYIYNLKKFQPIMEVKRVRAPQLQMWRLGNRNTKRSPHPCAQWCPIRFTRARRTTVRWETRTSPSSPASSPRRTAPAISPPPQPSHLPAKPPSASCLY